MKQIFRNCLISILTFLGISYCYRAWAQRRNPLVRVIVFHDVTDSKWFLETIVHLKKTYHLLSPEAFRSKEFDVKNINVLVTFDDGYASWVDVCLPILNTVGCKGLFFINSGLVDVYGDTQAQSEYVKNNLLLKSPRKTLSWEGTVSLLRAGHTIGGHTKAHRRLSELGDAAQEIEISADKKRIESMMSKTLVFFAYPFGNRGDFTKETEGIAYRAGYEVIFTTEAGFVREDTPSAIPRLCLEEGMSPTMLSQWIEGGYDLYAKLKRLCVR